MAASQQRSDGGKKKKRFCRDVGRAREASVSAHQAFYRRARRPRPSVRDELGAGVRMLDSVYKCGGIGGRSIAH